MVKSVDVEYLTLKSGKFAFSAGFNESAVMPPLEQARELYRMVDELPVLPALAAQLDTELIRRSIFGTAAIEGNPLSEEEVGNLLAATQGPDVSQAEREVLNLRDTYAAYLAGRVAVKDRVALEISEPFIKELHATVTTGLAGANEPGVYRNIAVKVGDTAHGGVYVPPKTLPDIKALMAILVDWLNGEPVRDLNPTIRAALAHYHFARIHPFQDGNGRTARLLEAVILHRAGVRYAPKMLSNAYYKNLDAYFQAFSDAERSGDATPFLVFFFSMLTASLEEVRTTVLLSIRRLALKEHVENLRRSRELTQRQHDLLRILLETDKRFALADLHADAIFRPLYANVSEVTARRDIKRLSALGLLIPEDGRQRVNFQALG